MSNININGKTFSGQNIVVRNGQVIIDGVDITSSTAQSKVMHIEVKGTLGTLITDASVTCSDVAGDVQAGGSIRAGNVGGDVQAGGSVDCRNVAGDIQAGGSVRHG